ncbi:MAG: hypothetical protein Q9162_005806 [Coniocarpon cinnabarinum]
MTPSHRNKSPRGSPARVAGAEHTSTNVNMTVAFKDTSSARKTSSNAACNNPASTNTQSNTQQLTDDDSTQDREASGGDEADDKGDVDETGDVLAPSAQSNGLEDSLRMPDATAKGMTQDLKTIEQAGPSGDTDNTQEREEEGGVMLIQEARRPSFSDISGTVSEASDFDVADDDDDYGAIDQLSQASENDASIEELDTHHLAANVQDWSQADTQMNDAKDQPSLDINWDDQRTYDFEFSFPYSDNFPAPSFMSEAMDSYGSQESDTRGKTTGPTETHGPMFVDFDPNMGMARVTEAMSASDRSSRKSSPEEASSKVKQEPDTAPKGDATASSDTEFEQLDDEIERRRRLSISKQKRKLSKKKRRMSQKSSVSSITPSSYKIQKFTPTPRRIHARPRMTGSGRVICLSVTDRTKMRWINGRVAVDPSSSAPSPELTRHIRSRMFQQAYCPNQSTLDLLRNPSMTGNVPQVTFNESSLRNDNFALALRNHSALQSMLATGNGDFSSFIDSDGEPGLTIAEQNLMPQDWIDDTVSMGGDLDELDVDNPYLETDMLKDEDETQGHSQDIDSTPCPKRQRRVAAQDDVDSPMEDVKTDDDNLERQQHMFSSPPPQSNHITV